MISPAVRRVAASGTARCVSRAGDGHRWSGAVGYLEEARRIAVSKENATGITAATIGKARVLGLIIDRREVGDVGAFDDMTDEELIREATRRARELGLGRVQPSNKAH